MCFIVTILFVFLCCFVTQFFLAYIVSHIERGVKNIETNLKHSHVSLTCHKSQHTMTLNYDRLKIIDQLVATHKIVKLRLWIVMILVGKSCITNLKSLFLCLEETSDGNTKALFDNCNFHQYVKYYGWFVSECIAFRIVGTICIWILTS